MLWYIYYTYQNTISTKITILSKYYQTTQKFISKSVDNTTYIPPKTPKSDYIWYLITNKAREQIWVVTSYDNGYYAWWYPPRDRGACTDVIATTLKGLNYDLKTKLDQDMKLNPQDYNNSYDANINFRRVVNIDTYMSKFAESKSINLWSGWFEDRLPGDIIIYDKIAWPKWLRHIAIISDKASSSWVPYIIHNYGNGTVQNDMLLKRPSNITARYRITTRLE